MSIQNQDKWHAMGSVAAAGTNTMVRGCTVARSATGIYAITLDEEVDASECAVLVSIRGGTSAYARVVQTSDAVKTVTIESAADGTTDVDRDFDFVILRAPANG